MQKFFSKDGYMFAYCVLVFPRRLVNKIPAYMLTYTQRKQRQELKLISVYEGLLDFSWKCQRATTLFADRLCAEPSSRLLFDPSPVSSVPLCSPPVFFARAASDRSPGFPILASSLTV